MNIKSFLLVMCIFIFSGHAAYDSYVVVDLEPGTVYKKENEDEVQYTVRDDRGTELVAWLFKEKLTYVTRTSNYKLPVVVKGTTIHASQREEAFKNLEKLWKEQEASKKQEESETFNEWCIINKEQP